jgi:hypothetical protein
MASVEAYQPRGHLSRSPCTSTRSLTAEGGSSERDVVTYGANDAFVQSTYSHLVKDARYEMFDYVMGLREDLYVHVPLPRGLWQERRCRYNTTYNTRSRYKFPNAALSDVCPYLKRKSAAMPKLMQAIQGSAQHRIRMKSFFPNCLYMLHHATMYARITKM